MPSPFDFLKGGAKEASEQAQAASGKAPGGLLGMMKIIDDNKGMLEKLPAMVEDIGGFIAAAKTDAKKNADALTSIVEKLDALAFDVARATADLARVVAILEPGAITETLHSELAAQAADDPRLYDWGRDPRNVGE